MTIQAAGVIVEQHVVGRYPKPNHTAAVNNKRVGSKTENWRKRQQYHLYGNKTKRVRKERADFSNLQIGM